MYREMCVCVCVCGVFAGCDVQACVHVYRV